MSADFQLSGFVADEGTTVGIAVIVEPETVLRAVALARLETPVDITTWLYALSVHDRPDEAAKALVQAHGGAAIFQPVSLDVAAILPHFHPTMTVAEA